MATSNEIDAFIKLNKEVFMYVVYQNGYYIMGWGETEKDAIAHANSELDADDQITDYKDSRDYDIAFGDIVCRKCTQRLIDALNDNSRNVDENDYVEKIINDETVVDLYVEGEDDED